jgi:copper transport protein
MLVHFHRISRIRTIRAALVVSLLAASLLFLQAGIAQAHSVLVSSNPPSGANLAGPPAAVQMIFSEGVEPAFSSFSVIDRTRKSFAAGQPTIDRVKGLVTIPMQPNLPAGAYIVQWKVVSVVDGHLTRGSFAFNVQPQPGAPSTPTSPGSVGSTGTTSGTPAPAPSPVPTVEALPSTTNTGTSGESASPSVLDVAVRWLDTLLAACLVGGAVFNLFIVPGATASLQEGQESREGRDEVRARLQLRLVLGSLAAGVLLLLALGAELILQAMRATETDLGSVFAQPDVFGAVLASSFGGSLQLRALTTLAMILVLLVLLAANLAARRAGRRTSGGLFWLWALIVVLGAGFYWAQTGSAHATALSEQPGAGILQALAPYANLVHLLSTAIWIGGIFYFVVVLLPVLRGVIPKSRSVVLRESITRFSQIALVTVPVVALSGAIIYLAEQPSVESTLDTGYGREVLVKVGLLAVLMIPAAYNLRRVGPGLVRLRDMIGPAFQALARGFRRSVRIEALMVSTVLVFSALLTLSAPATDPSAYKNEGAQAAGLPSPTAVAQLPAISSPTPAAIQAPEATPTDWPPSTLTLTQTVRGVQVALNVVHSAVDDKLNVTLKDSRGVITACGPTPTPNADCALWVKLTLTELDDNASNTVEAPYTPTVSGGQSAVVFAVPEGPYMPLDGSWQIVVAVRRYNQPDDIKAAFRYELDGASMTGKVSDYVNVDASTNPDPPKSGPVDLIFHLTDNNGQPVNDATVMVQGIMPAHGHVTELKKMDNSNGTYTANLLMPMSGGWSVELSIARPGHDTVSAEVALDLASSGYDLTPYPSPNTTPVGP